LKTGEANRANRWKIFEVVVVVLVALF